MWYYIVRKSDNNYVKKLSLSFIESNEWTNDVSEAEKYVIGRCESFKRRFPEVEVEIIPTD